MNKKTIRIAGWALGLSMAVAGIGVAAATSFAANSVEPVVMKAAAGDEHDMGVAARSTLLNNDASIPSINLEDPGYYISKITVNARYNKSLNPGVTISASVGGVSFGSVGVSGTGTSYEDFELTGSEVAKGAISITFTNHSGSGTGKGTFYIASVSVTEAAAPAATNPITSISAVSLSRYSVPANYSKAITATATFAPGNTDELITWTSSDEGVATISNSSTNGIGNITLVGEGTCTFTASNSDGTITRTSDAFTVTEAEIQKVYNITFTGTGNSTDSNTALTYEGLATSSLGDGSLLTYSSTSGEVAYVYNGGDESVKFGSSKNNGKITINQAGEDDGDNIKMVLVEAKKYGTDSSSLAVTVGTNSSQNTGTLEEDYNYYSFSFATAAKKIVLASTNRLYIRNLILIVDGNAAEQGAYSFSGNLLNGTAEGCADLNEGKLATAWSTLSSAYSSAESTYAGMSALFKSASADEDGDVIERAAARYDYIVRKYGTGTFTDFANRNPGLLGGASYIFSGDSDKGFQMPLIVTVIAASAIVSGGLFFLQRKRRNED